MTADTVEECNCDCHTNPDIVHCAPCCAECCYCGKRIKMPFFNSHRMEHERNEDEEKLDIRRFFSII